MSRMLVVAAATIIVIAGGPTAYAEGNDLIVKESDADFATTVSRLQAGIEERGATIVATVDHAPAAKKSGLVPLPTMTVIIFGNPALGTPLMQRRQTAGLDLPLRVLIWVEEGGKREPAPAKNRRRSSTG